MVKSMGVGDTVFVGPEAEFFVFDDVRFSVDPYNTGFKLDSSELPTNSDTEYEGGNLGHRIRTKGGYFPVPPQDFGAGHALGNARRDGQDGRQGREASPRSRVRPARTRHEVRHADAHGRPDADLQILHPSGRAHLRQDRHLHAEAGLWRQRLGHARATSRSGRTASRYSPATNMPISPRPACHYIGGIIKHAKAINAFTNPSTNSYKRLVPGYEAPVLLAYSARNRSASCRIPYTSTPKAKRVEVRFPDPMANPVSRLRRDADGRPRRHQEQDRSGSGDGQGPLRSAEGRAEVDPDGVRSLARSAGKSRQGPRASSRTAACSTTTSSTATSS